MFEDLSRFQQEINLAKKWWWNQSVEEIESAVKSYIVNMAYERKSCGF